MKNSICGADCNNCFMKENCGGCAQKSKNCFIAQYINVGSLEKFLEFKQTLIDEFNALNIPGMPEVEDLNILEGSFVNLEYTLPSGESVKFLNDNSMYLGNQLECEFDSDYCFGIISSMDFLLVCRYGENGANPELLMYKKR